MDEHTYIDDFSLLLNPHLWYNLTTVGVVFFWRDVRAKRLFIILIDRNVSLQCYLYFNFMVIYIFK